MIRCAHRRWLRGLPALLGVLVLALSGCARADGRVVSLSPRHSFRQTVKPVISSPVALDCDGDGMIEIAVGSWDGHFYLIDSQLESLPGWPKHSRRGFFPSPALGDVDGDGQTEIIVGSDIGKLYAWRADGSDVPGFPISLGYRTWASPSILSDGRIAIAGFGRIHLLDSHGQPVPGWPRPMPDWSDATVAALGDLVAVTTLRVGTLDRGSLCAWHLDGCPYDWSPLRLERDSDSSPAIADLTGDGQVEIIFGDDSGLLHVIDQDGREVPGFPTQAESLIEASPAIADVDGDGRPDIVVGSWDGRMYVWDRHGQLLPGWPVQVGDQIISSAALVDLDGDDRLDIVVGSKDHFLYGWSGDGETLSGFPYDLRAHVFSSPWVGDVDADGDADIVVGANNGIHLLRDVGLLGRSAWPMFHRDEANSGAVP